MHHFKTWFKASWNYSVGTFQLSSVMFTLEILNLFILTDKKVAVFFWFDLVKSLKQMPIEN